MGERMNAKTTDSHEIATQSTAMGSGLRVSKLILQFIRTMLAASTLLGIGLVVLVQTWTAEAALAVALISTVVMLGVISICRPSKTPGEPAGMPVRFLVCGLFAPAFAVFLCSTALFIQLQDRPHPVNAAHLEVPAYD